MHAHVKLNNYVHIHIELGKILAANNIRLVYGGGSVGLMGAVAKGTIENGGMAIGIVPEPLFRHGSKQLCESVIVPDMHTRKKRMEEECDAFVCLPGGYGTMEEMLEMITWSQLNIHSKPILLLDTKGYYKLFVDWIKLSVQGSCILKLLDFVASNLMFIIQKNSFMPRMLISLCYVKKPRTLWTY